VTRRTHRYEPPPWARGEDRPHGWPGARDWAQQRVRRGPSPKGVAVMLALVQIFGTRAAAYGQAHPTLDTVGYLLLAAGPAALLVRDRFPVVALLGALAATVAYFSFDYPNGPAFLAAIVAVFTALRLGRRLQTWLSVAVALGAYIGIVHHSTRDVIFAAVGSLATLVFGEGARARTAWYSEMVKAREEEQKRAREEEERAHQEQERRQVSEERLTIARELHDVLGHHLSLINVQAGVGLHLMDEKPEQARTALAAIKHASAEALRETRAVLAALNPDPGNAPRTPLPGLDDLGALVEEVGAAGLPVSLAVEGTPRTLPPEVGRAAFRIVQEALTNIRRHAGPSATASILIGYRPSAVTVEVLDDGKGVTGTGDTDGGGAEGNGIAGMRERAKALGGTVTAGPRPDQEGFEVRFSVEVP
jgi:signal transduction histidine kinase